MSLDFRVAALPYKSSSFAAPLRGGTMDAWHECHSPARALPPSEPPLNPLHLLNLLNPGRPRRPNKKAPSFESAFY